MYKKDPVLARPYEVRIEEVGNNQDRLVKKFLKKAKKEDILRPFLDKRYYRKPSEKKREKKRRAEFLRKKELNEEK